MAPLIIDTGDPDHKTLYANLAGLLTIGLAAQVRNDGPVKVVIIPVTKNLPSQQPPLLSDSEPTDAYQLAIGLADQAATSGTFGLTVAGSTTNLTALAFNVSAAALQTPFNVAMLAGGKPQATITSIGTGSFRIDANTVGAIPTGTVAKFANALVPTCDIEIDEVSLGGASEKYNLVLQIRQAPLAYCEPSTALPATGVTRTNEQVLTSTENAIDSISFGPATPTSGTYSIATYGNGVTKTVIAPWNATPAELQAILETNSKFTGNLTVTGSGTTRYIEFTGGLGPKQITGSTVANPTVITCANHGYSSGQTVEHSGTNSTPPTDGAQVVTYLTANTYSVPVNVTVAGTAGISIPDTAPSVAVSDIDLASALGVSGDLYLNNENLYAYSLAQTGESFDAYCQITRTRASGARETILLTGIQLFKDMVSRGTLVPLPLPSYFTSTASDARYGQLAVANTWTDTNDFGAITATGIDVAGDIQATGAILAVTGLLSQGYLVAGYHATAIDYTVSGTTCIVGVTSTAAARIATIPNATTVFAGQVYIVKDESGAANVNNITVKTAGGTIDGIAAGTGKVINTAYGVVRAYSNGTNWFTF